MKSGIFKERKKSYDWKEEQISWNRREKGRLLFFSFEGRIKDCRMNKSAVVLFVVLLCGSAWAEITTIITNSTITTAQKWAAFETTTCMSSFPFYILCICNLFSCFLF